MSDGDRAGIDRSGLDRDPDRSRHNILESVHDIELRIPSSGDRRHLDILIYRHEVIAHGSGLAPYIAVRLLTGKSRRASCRELIPKDPEADLPAILILGQYQKRLGYDRQWAEPLR